MKLILILPFLASMAAVDFFSRPQSLSEHVPFRPLFTLMVGIAFSLCGFALGSTLLRKHKATTERIAAENTDLWQEQAAIQLQISKAKGNVFKNQRW
ncbi:MAG: hypothetical protein ACI8T1_000855 [Verrucomicrobiales bacterium]|jgi:hypothetical protein